MAYKTHRLLIILSLTLLIFIGLILFFNKRDALKYVNSANKSNAYINIQGQDLELEVVSSVADTYQGLSGRDYLCLKCGMLFVFTDLSPRSFVMRNMLIPLDIIFIADGSIVKIYKDLAPEGPIPQKIYDSILPANYVLEINAGQADQLGLQVGNKLEIKIK